MTGGMTEKAAFLESALWSEPLAAQPAVAQPVAQPVVRYAAGALRVREGVGPAALTSERRRTLRRQLAAGALESLTFEAVTFRAVYPNANFLRFRDEDLPVLAESFCGAPFLRDHDRAHLDARGGAVAASRFDGDALVQEITLTVPRDMEAFLNGQMDRFSISWNWEGITCSVCGRDWLSGDCLHWPGRRYAERQPRDSLRVDL